MAMVKTMKNSPCPLCNLGATFLFRKNYRDLFFDIFQCQSCGLGFVNPMPTPQELEAFYQHNYYQNNKQLGYNAPYGSLEKGLKKTYEHIIKRVQLLSRKTTFPSVLDVGCAYGYFLDCAKESMSSTIRVGIDLSQEAEKNISKKGHYFLKGHFQNVNIPFSSFDLIFMGDVFEHFPDPIPIMARLEELTKPKGVVVITTVNFSSLAARILKQRWRLMTPPEHLLFWTPTSIKKLFATMGWYGIVSQYTLYYPKEYINIVFQKQFGFPPFFLKPLPFKIIPIPSYDVMLAIFWKPR